MKDFVSVHRVQANSEVRRRVPVGIEQNVFCCNKINECHLGVGFGWYGNEKSRADGERVCFCNLKDEGNELSINQVPNRVCD